MQVRNQNNEFEFNILSSNQETFSVNGTVNKENYRYYESLYQMSYKNDWAGIFKKIIIG